MIFVIISIFIIFLFNQIAAFGVTSILIFIYSLLYLISLAPKRKIIRIIKENYVSTDISISTKLNQPLEQIREKLSSLSKRQRRKKWLITLINIRYICYNEEAIQKFTEFYHNGYNEKEILEKLSKVMRVKNRAEIKAIRDTLIMQKRIIESYN